MSCRAPGRGGSTASIAWSIRSRTTTSWCCRPDTTTSPDRKHVHAGGVRRALAPVSRWSCMYFAGAVLQGTHPPQFGPTTHPGRSPSDRPTPLWASNEVTTQPSRVRSASLRLPLTAARHGSGTPVPKCSITRITLRPYGTSGAPVRTGRRYQLTTVTPHTTSSRPDPGAWCLVVAWKMRKGRRL